MDLGWGSGVVVLCFYILSETRCPLAYRLAASLVCDSPLQGDSLIRNNLDGQADTGLWSLPGLSRGSAELAERGG